MHDMIGLTKKQELAEHKEEVRYRNESKYDPFDEVADLCGSSFDASADSGAGHINYKKKYKKKGNSEISSRSAPMMMRMSRSAEPMASAPMPSPPLTATATRISDRISSSASVSQTNESSSPVPKQPANALLETSGQDNSDNNQTEVRDCTLLPSALNEKFDHLDKDGAVRPVVLSVGKAWEKRSQKALLAAATTATLLADEQKTEKSAAFDLLDALSRSGGLVIDNTDLHVVLMSTHCFDKTLMNTIVQKNTNPIEKMEQSTLIMASVVHGRSAGDLVNESQHERLLNQAAMLFEED
jgi:hypothetical protein